MNKRNKSFSYFKNGKGIEVVINVLKFLNNLKKKCCKHEFEVTDTRKNQFQRLTDDRGIDYKVTIKCKKCGLEKKKIMRM